MYYYARSEPASVGNARNPQPDILVAWAKASHTKNEKREKKIRFTSSFWRAKTKTTWATFGRDQCNSRSLKLSLNEHISISMTVGQEKIFIKHCDYKCIIVSFFGLGCKSAHLLSSFSTALSHVAIWISYGVQFHTKILWVSLKQNRQNKTEKNASLHRVFLHWNS